MKRRHLLGMAAALLGAAASACTITEGPIDDTCGESETLGAVTIVSYCPATVDSTGETEVPVSVAEGAQSFALVVDGAGSELVIANKVTSPSGLVVFDWNADVSINRTDATDGLYTLLVPTTRR